ncbi:hypothetical protein L873DRAFT_1791536 [Choiromyces venosus 120613-1]|uniref:Uncharacterized protein n=1 Tax=Choiromyces venosus 120613-1 TaxID=1336337 RepID=A0A3N4JE61_9PEZI|nr:hypothetical protein L873DRAFT_1791536 [Choiromyces venosus 120613-1]
MLSLTMHSQFILLFLLHKAVASQEYPLFRTNNIFSPVPDILPAIAVASVASKSAAPSVSTSQAVETDDGTREYVHYQKRQEDPFPIQPGYRLVYNDGALGSVPNEGVLKSGYINLLPRASRGNALEIDTSGIVRVRNQFGLSTPVDDTGSSYPELIRPDDRDPAPNVRLEKKRGLEKKFDHIVYYPGVNRRNDILHRRMDRPRLRGSRENSELVERSATTESKDQYPIFSSNNQMSPQPVRISSEGEYLNRRSPSFTPPYFDEKQFPNFLSPDKEKISENIDMTRVRRREDGSGYKSGTNSRNEYPLFMSDNTFGSPTKGSSRPVTARSGSGINGVLNQKRWFDERHFRCFYPAFMTNNQFQPPLTEHNCLRENVPAFLAESEIGEEDTIPSLGSAATSDLSSIQLLSRNVIPGVSSAEIPQDGVYTLQRGDDGAMRSVLVKRLDANPVPQRGLGRPIRPVEMAHDGEVYVVDATDPNNGSKEVKISPVVPITIPEEASPISTNLRLAKPVNTVDDSKSEEVGSLDRHDVFETSDDWMADSVGSTHPFEFGKGGGSCPGELGRNTNKKPVTPGETSRQPLARRPPRLEGRSQVSVDPSPSAIYAIEFGDDGEMRSRIVQRRSNKELRSTGDFGRILSGAPLDAVDPAGKGQSWPPSDSRVSISSPLMADYNGQVYHKIIQARSENAAHVFNSPESVPATGVRPVYMNEIGQLLSKDLGTRERNGLLNIGERTVCDSALAPVGCAVQEGVDGRLHPRSLKRRSIDGSDYIMPFVRGNPIQLVPDLAQTVNENGEAPMVTTEIAEATEATNMTLLFHSMTLDKLAVVLPLVMFGTLLLVLVVFGMTFCCLRQAEETYHINIKAIENRRRRNRSSRRRRKHNASTGAAEEGDITVPPGAYTGQPGAGNTNNSWFLQRWYNLLRGDNTIKKVPFSTPEEMAQRIKKENEMWARGLDGGQDSRDPSYILDAVSDRLQQTRGRPRSLSTIWSDGVPESSAPAKAVLATGRKSSEGASPNTAMMSRRMHGAKGDSITDVHQESISTTGTTGISENPSSELALTLSPVECSTDTLGPGIQEPLRSEGTFRMIIDEDLSIPDNLREPKEFVRVIRPDLYLSGPGTGDTSEPSETGKDSWIEDNGTILRRREGDTNTRGRKDEAGPLGNVEDGGDRRPRTASVIAEEFLFPSDGDGLDNAPPSRR